MSECSQQQAVVYEQDEVVWAKVKGYPWWPAFVDKIGNKKNGEAQYTVYFFGDNTHSVLGASKLRKFSDYYTELYPKAKTHKKLMQAIQKAEERLKQNEENVDIFEALRDSIKERKRRRPKSDQKACSPLQSCQKIVNEEVGVCSKDDQSMNQKMVESCLSIDKKDRQSLQNKLQGPLLQQSDRMMLYQKMQVEGNGDECVERKQMSAQQGREQLIKEQQYRQAEDGMMDEKEPLTPINNKKEKVISSVISSSESEDSINSSKKYRRNNPKSINTRIKALDVRANKNVIKKRGRPKKPMNDSPPKSQRLEIKAVQKMKTIRKGLKGQRVKVYKQGTLSAKDSQIISDIRQIINDREGLIAYLNTIVITVDNVKPILDLDVSIIIQNGTCTPPVIHLLQLFKVTLLAKYFPEELKYLRKYERLIKKNIKHLEAQSEQDKKQEEAKKQKLQQKKQQKKEQQKMEQSRRQMRQKTLSKISKFLKKQGAQISLLKESACRIQQYFKQYDGQIGVKYRQMAFKVLSWLKEGVRAQQLLERLSVGEFE